MAPLLPRDNTPLTDAQEQVLRTVYDEFDKTGMPVLGTKIAFTLRGKVPEVRAILGSQELQTYLRRTSAAGGNDFFAPTLRAALRLGRERDLTLVSDIYEYAARSISPERQSITRAEFAAEYSLPQRFLSRMMHLLANESFVSLHSEASGDQPAVYLNERLLDSPTLAEYLVSQNQWRAATETVRPRVNVGLDRVALRNFRLFEDASLDLASSLTVLAGRNESGKTSLLQALRFASAAASFGAKRALDWEGGPAHVFRRSQNGSGVLSLELHLRTESWGPGLYELVLDRQPTNPIVKERLVVDGVEHVSQARASAMLGDQNIQLVPGESALASLSDVKTQNAAISIREGLRTWAFFDFVPSAIRRPDSLSYLREREPTRFSLESDGSNLPRALFELGAHDPDRLAELSRAYASLVPEYEPLRVEPTLKGDPVLLLRRKGLTDPFTQADLSDGMLRILALLYVAYHPEPPSLVCIEEPENGLYPRLIEAMTDALRALSRRTQVILTTHSVTLMNTLRPSELVFAERSDSGASFHRVDGRADVVKFMEKFGLGDQLYMGSIENPP